MAGLPTIILGAGLAGLSLARALLHERPGEPIVLVDRRTEWARDRTWSFWEVPGLPWTEFATARWQAWRTVGRAGAPVQRSRRHPYLHLPADRFYDAALDAVGTAPGVELLSGTRVRGVRVLDGDRGVEVRTDRGTIEGAVAVDAMGGGGPLLRGRPAGAVELQQRFVGLEVETERPVFDPAVATLMDFRVPAIEGAVRFVYVLPYSPTRALVEDTTLGGPAIPAAARRAAVREYLDQELGAGAIEVRREERGALPMSTYRFPTARGPRLLAAGQAAGAARPSSGYAFVRTQQHAVRLARALARGTEPPGAIDPPRRRALDELFLRALAAAPESAPSWFQTMTRRVPGSVFARFMSDAAGLADEARVIAALRSPSFLAALAHGERSHGGPSEETAAGARAPQADGSAARA